MPEVKLSVTADTSGVSQAVNKVTQDTGNASKVINRAPKWNPVDLKAQEEAYRKSQQLFADHLKKMDALAKRYNMQPGGGAGAGGAGGGGNSNLPPTPPPPTPPNPVPPPPKPTPQSRRGRHAYTYSPDVSDIARNFSSGFGGGASMVGSYAARGAIAGANAGEGGGGLLGGGLGLLKGFGIGSLAFGALKLGQMGSEGMDMAKDRNGSLDTLKRQMGDLGVSFVTLKGLSEAAAEGMGINSKEAAELAQQFNHLSRGAEYSPEGLADAVRTGTGLGKAYGLDPSAGVGYLAGMRNIDPRQNNRDLAIMLADTIARSGMNAKADEVMRSMTAYAQAVTRMSLSDPNMGAYSSAYSSLMGAGYRGMTGDVASNVLMQANGAMTHMGAMGEASQNFTYTALRNAGGTGLNPFTARTQAEGGLFGTRASVFAGDTPLARLYSRMGENVSGLASGRGANTTNLEAIVNQIERSGMKAGVKNDMLRNYFGLGSDQQSAALYNMALDSKGQKGGGLLGQIQRAGIDPKNINAGGLQTMAQIGKAGSMADLQSIYGDMAKRTGKAQLTDGDKAMWQGAQGDFTKMQDALLKISASKDKEETDASRMNDSMKAIETAQITVGDKLLVPLNAIREGMLAMTGSGSDEGLHAKVLKIRRSEINERYDQQAHDALRVGQMASLDARTPGYKMDAKTAKILNDSRDIEKKRKAELDALDAEEAARVAAERKPDPIASGVGPTAPATAPAGDGDKRARIAAMEKAHHQPAGMLLGLWGTESGFGKKRGKGPDIKLKDGSVVNAVGDFQFLPSTAKGLHFEPGKDFDTDLDGAARLMDKLYKQKGNWPDALLAYGGVKDRKDVGEDYLRKIQKNGGFHLGDGPVLAYRAAGKAQKFGGSNLDDVTPMDVRSAGGLANAGGAPANVNMVITLKQQSTDARGAVQERQLGTTKVSAPRGAGAVNVEAAL